MSIFQRPAIRAGCALALLLVALLAPLPTAGRATAVAPQLAPAALACGAQAHTLYDGRLGGTPDTQGMSYQAYNKQTGVVSATQSFSSGVTTLDTMPQRGDYAGYVGGAAVPALDRTRGYTLTFDLQLVSENHVSNNRAGLSVIVLSSDKRGIELAMWQDRVWVQNDGAAEPPAGTLFTHGEEALFATTSAIVHYTLAIRGGTYALAANGAALLSGPLRDYTAFNGFPDVYEIPNFVFLGDDTSSARANVRLAALAVDTTTCGNQLYLPLVLVPSA